MVRQVPLSQGKFALVNDEDYDRIMAIGHWHAVKDGGTYYAICNVKDMLTGKHTTIRVHRAIMNPPVGMQVDHINGNGLDNRRCNLRIVSHRQNLQNRHGKITSQYPGVHWHKATQKWQAKATINGHQKYLGLFVSELDAYEAYKEVIEFSGENVIV